MGGDYRTGGRASSDQDDFFPRNSGLAFRTPAHTNDPPAAKDAAKSIDLTARAERTLGALKRFVDRYNRNPNSADLASFMRTQRHDVARGLSDLKAAGKAVHVGRRDGLTTWGLAPNRETSNGIS